MKRAILLSGLLLAASGTVNAAPIYSLQLDDPGQNPAGGRLSSIDTTYDPNAGTFSWAYTVEGPTSQPHNGFWLVVNDGPTNPKGEDGNLAILYGDLVSRNVTAYVYDGNNDPGSWQSSEFLESFAGAIEVSDVDDNTRDVSFSIDVGREGGTSGINNRSFDPAPSEPWQGVAFGEEIGIWLHSTSGNGAPATYNADGSLASFATGASGWVDTGGLETHVVPEPGVLYLSALGLAAFGASRRLTSRR